MCFVFGARSNISLQTFNSDIILDNANVWFSKWRGIRHDRLPINGHKELERDYEGKEKIQAMVKASPRILRDSRKYVNAYLKANFNEYTAVAFRTQKRKDVLVLKDKYSRKEVIEYFYKCGEEVKNVMRNIYPSNQTFLSIDLGRFGDMSGGGYDYFKINDDGKKLLEFMLKITNSNKSIAEYHNELIRAVKGIQDTAWVHRIGRKEYCREWKTSYCSRWIFKLPGQYGTEF